MANIHKVLIGKFFTIKHPNGMLSSEIGVRDILQKQLPKREFKRYKHEINERVAPKLCVVYDKGLLDEPDLDDKLAENIGYIHRYSNIDVCRPNIILLMRDYKGKSVSESKIYGYHDIVKMLFSNHLSTDLRIKAYEIFHKAITVDERNGSNTFYPTLQLSWLFFPDINEYQKLINTLWFDPNFDPDQRFDWGHYLDANKGTVGNSKNTPYYNDDRFIGIINKLYDENKAVLFRTMINRFGEHLPRFRKVG